MILSMMYSSRCVHDACVCVCVCVPRERWMDLSGVEDVHLRT